MPRVTRRAQIVEGVHLPGFDALLRRETGLPVVSDSEPLTTVARGAGAAVEEIESQARSRRRRRG